MQKSLHDENDQNIKLDENLRVVKTVEPNEVKSKALSTVNEKENDFSSRSKRSKKNTYTIFELRIILSAFSCQSIR